MKFDVLKGNSLEKEPIPMSPLPYVVDKDRLEKLYGLQPKFFLLPEKMSRDYPWVYSKLSKVKGDILV